MSTSLLSLLWWVAIGLFFFWMMSRGGCGMMGHGHRDSSGHTTGHGRRSASGYPVDPVCRMEVDPAKAAATRIVGRDTYFFCSQNCLDAFDRNPSMYAPPHDQQATHHHHVC